MLHQLNELEKVLSDLQGKQPDLYKRLFEIFQAIYYEILKTISRAGSWDVVCRLQGQAELIEKIISFMREGGNARD